MPIWIETSKLETKINNFIGFDVFHVLNFFLCILHGHDINAFKRICACSAVAYNFQAYAHMQCALKINMCMLCISKKIQIFFRFLQDILSMRTSLKMFKRSLQRHDRPRNFRK